MRLQCERQLNCFTGSETTPFQLCVSFLSPSYVSWRSPTSLWCWYVNPSLWQWERWVLTIALPANSPSCRLDATVRAKSLQLCPTLCDPMVCSPPGSSVHGDSPGKSTGVGCHALLRGIFPTQGWNSGLLQLLPCRWILHRRATREALTPEGVEYKCPQLFTAAFYWPLARFCSLRSLSPKKESCLGPASPSQINCLVPSTHTTHTQRHNDWLLRMSSLGIAFHPLVFL